MPTEAEDTDHSVDNGLAGARPGESFRDTIARRAAEMRDGTVPGIPAVQVDAMRKRLRARD